MASRKFDNYLLLIVFLAAVYAIWWSFFISFRYATFQEGIYDLGTVLYSFYAHAFYPVGGLQSLVFTNHVSFLSVLFVPIFRQFADPLTLVVLQNISLGLAAIFIYLIGREITKNRLTGFVLAVAFLVSSAVIGISLFDVHLEGFLPFLYLLTFYFYIKRSTFGFIGSYIVLVSLMDTAVFVGLTMLIGLAFYEILYNNKLSKKMKDTAMRLSPLIACFVITAVFLLLYHLIITDLISSYSSGTYANLPPPLKLIDSFSIQSLALSEVFTVPPYAIALFVLGICGAALLFLGFGPASLADPILSIILISPWLGEVFIVHNVIFTFLGNQYYSYGIGGAVVAALLGLRILIDRKQKAYSFFRGARLDLAKFNIYVFAFAFFLFLFSFAVLYPITLTYIQAPQIFSFAPASLDYAQMSNALNSIPINSSVMTQPLIYPHLYKIRNLELTSNQRLPGFVGSGLGYFNLSLYWFRPEYVVIDPVLSDYNAINDSSFNVYGYMGGNYTLVNSSDGLMIYRIRNASASST